MSAKTWLKLLTLRQDKLTGCTVKMAGRLPQNFLYKHPHSQYFINLCSFTFIGLNFMKVSDNILSWPLKCAAE